MSDNITKRVGLGTAYGFAKAGGYEGTVAEFTELLGNIAIDLARIENLSVTVTTLPAGSQATASLNGSVLSLGIPKGDKGDKGNTGETGAPAGFGTVSATVDANIGTPSVEVTASGADTAKNFAFAFHNLKGQKGDKGDTGEVSQAQLDAAVSDLKSDINDNTSDISALQASVTNLGTHKVAQPLDGNNQPTNGTSGQSLRTKGDGTTEWASVGLPTDEQTEEAINAWLDEHPEATTTVLDGSIGKKKLTESLSKEFESKMSRNDIWQLSMQEEKMLDFSSFNANIQTNYSPQGVCYNLDTEQFVFTFSNNSDWSLDSLIIVADSSFNKVSEHYAQLWHANDITYNPSTHQYVVAPSHDDGEIIVLDNLFNVVQVVNIEGIPSERVLQIAYDATDGGYFLTTGDTRKTYKVNSEFMQPRLFADQTLNKFTENTYMNVYTFDVQGCDAYNGELISLAWFWRSGSETNGITRIGVFHDGDEDCYYKFDYPHSLWSEPEAVCIVNDGGYVFSYYGSNLVIRKLFINSNMSDISTDTTLQYFEISSMDAWQEYSKTIPLRAGRYIIDVYTNTISYANAQQAFRLSAEHGTGNFYSNTVITYNGVPTSINLTKLIDIKNDINLKVTLFSDKAYTAKTLYVNIRILHLQNA